MNALAEIRTRTAASKARYPFRLDYESLRFKRARVGSWAHPFDGAYHLSVRG